MKEYKVGYFVKDGIMRAEVFIRLIGYSNWLDKTVLNRFFIHIKTDNKYTAKQLKDFGINLPFYTRSQKNWNMQLTSKKELNPELNRLRESGFVIPKDANKGLSALLAEEI